MREWSFSNISMHLSAQLVSDKGNSVQFNVWCFNQSNRTRLNLKEFAQINKVLNNTDTVLLGG